MSQTKAAYKIARVSEHEEQANFITEVGLRYSNRSDFAPVLLFAVPNGAWLGGENRYALMAKYKREGFRSGVADLLYLQPRGEYAYLALEFKAIDRANAKDGGVSAEQAEFLAAVNQAGGTGEVVYGAEDAMRVFSWYMSLEARV